MRQFILRNGAKEVSARLKEFIDTLDLTKPKKVVITDYNESMSDRQRRTYRMWCGIIADEIGYTKSEMHEVLLDELAPKKFVMFKGKEIAFPVRTSEMDVKQMSEFMNQVVILAAGQGINLPFPDDYMRDMQKMRRDN